MRGRRHQNKVAVGIVGKRSNELIALRSPCVPLAGIVRRNAMCLVNDNELGCCALELVSPLLSLDEIERDNSDGIVLEHRLVHA